MRILLDENIHPQVVALLRDAGHDVLSITETDKGASDPVVFQTAVSDERVLVTHDTGFSTNSSHQRVARSCYSEWMKIWRH